MKKLLLFCLCAALPAFGQAYSSSVLQNSPGNYGRPVPFASVMVCPITDIGTPCTSRVTTYTNYTLTTACTVSSGSGVLTGAPTSGTGCNNPGTADASGNFTLYVPTGQYRFCSYAGGWLCQNTSVGGSVALTGSFGALCYFTLTPVTCDPLATTNGSGALSALTGTFNTVTIGGSGAGTWTPTEGTGVPSPAAGKDTAFFSSVNHAFTCLNSSSRCNLEMPGFIQGCIVNGVAYVGSGVPYTTCWGSSDIGAQINAADAALGGTAGEIVVSSGSSWTTAISLSAGHILKFSQGGTYTIGATITLAGGTGISGTSSSQGFGFIMLQEAAGANLAELIHVTGAEVDLQHFVLDGNKSNNSTEQDGILVDHALHYQQEFVGIQNFKRHGISVLSTSNESASGRIIGGGSQLNGSDGIFCTLTNDWYLSAANFDNNGANQIELSNCSAWRMIQNDFGGVSGGTGYGLYAYGTAASSIGSNQGVLIGNQFGNMPKDAIHIVGNDTSTQVAVGWNIVGNNFIGTNWLAADNTYFQINLIGGGSNTITGNAFASSSSPDRFANAINISGTITGNPNDISSNVENEPFGGSFGSGFFSDTSTSVAVTNVPAGLAFNESASVPNATSGKDICRGDSTAHSILCSLNNGSFSALLFAGQTNVLTSAGTLDASAATGSNAFKVPVKAGAVATASGAVAFDSTAGNFVAGKAGTQVTVCTTAGEAGCGGSGTTANFYISPWGGSAGFNFPTANTTRLFAFVSPNSISGSTKLYYHVSAADNSANLYDIGIYNSSGTLVCHVGATAGTTLGPSTGDKSIAWASACSLTGGNRYYWALTGNSNVLGLNGAASVWSPVCNVVPATGSTTSGGVLNGTVTFSADAPSTCIMPNLAIVP